jgi:SNF2 family DNA or RNA helicase
MRLPLAPGGLKIALSGTPWRGKVLNSWGTLSWIRPDVFTSYWNFAKLYFDVDDGERGGLVVSDELRPDREEDFDRMIAPYLLRRTKAEVAPDLPPKMYAGTRLSPKDPDSPVGVWLDMTPEQEKSYRDITEDGLTEDRRRHAVANGILAEMTRQEAVRLNGGRINFRQRAIGSMI